ncbi:Cysteine-rich receptor-like protein kinase 25 [Camellia lanceoleosa]|uniref:Cysteine-rich receptor-like protein kinase 25 n=1 Tax=Camellia lanceoleosa TaxID=1840588 RepID=A0ACC0GFM0_9ERIC|nr:Cysteine-rich receptor-like protein kinase 25 [Camellia lanceoleosa]
MNPSSFFHISRAIFFVRFLFCFLILNKTKADPTYQYNTCPNTTTYTPNSTYQTNLNTLLSVLSLNSSTTTSGFSNFTAGSSPDTAHGLFLCRGDVSTEVCHGNISMDVCHECVTTATKDVLQKCPNSKVVTIWYDECILRYSNQPILSIDDQSGPLILINIENITAPNRFRDVLGGVLDDIVTRASNNLSGKKFATKEANFTSLQKLYGLAQCIPDISSLDCNTCLRKAISSFQECCDGRKGARVLYSGCTFRFETYPFYATTSVAAAPPPLPLLPPPPPPRRRHRRSPTAPSSSPGKGGISSSQVLIAIVVPVGASVLLFFICFCFLRRKAKTKYHSTKEDSAANEITTVESLQYDFGTIQAATDNFSDDNKIGEGGFGHVYKGKLINGEEIAVKRLSQNSGQGEEEFKNEVLLVAKLQHRNLIRLLGFCLEGEEKILIYEFMPNKSLDRILFDSQEHEKLDWPKRYQIIGGIARGMLYLHEDSQLRIIHRDLKASNILLDWAMNAKISDFGIARIFGVDQSQGFTSRVVGTFSGDHKWQENQ